ncbi:MAG: hypothetical protein ACRC18_07045 [Cetobacterium sp.]
MIKIRRILSIVIFVACVVAGNVILIKGLDKEQKIQFEITKDHLTYVESLNK